ncbi:MAG: glutathione S-transferase [Halieaceae bacterium]|nr:glutathione S-transferase [Halieaceae bacterium]|tara:strand:- start:468 stop:860 length:393 start_codon:yes stop_codon:yes gene_type:complete
MITALYASLLAILLFILSIRVIGLRGNPAFALIAQGKGDDELLQRAVRAHGNFTEYVPTMLILLYFLESSGVAGAKLHALAGAFFLGRVMHGICMGFMRSNMPLRVGGTALTLLPLATAAVALLMQVFQQ